MLPSQLLMLVAIFIHHQPLVHGTAAVHPSANNDFCITIDLNYGRNDQRDWNSLQVPECQETNQFEKTVIDQATSHRQDSFLNQTADGYAFNDSGSCTVVSSRNLSVCNVVREMNMHSFANRSWIIVNSSSQASCHAYNSSFTICWPNSDKLCTCQKWYHIESDCVFQNNDSDAFYHFFANSSTNLREYPAIKNKNIACKPSHGLLEAVRAMLMLVLAGVSVVSLVASVTIHLLLFRSSHDVLPLLCHKVTLLVCYIIFLVRPFRRYSRTIACINGGLYFAGQCAFLSSFLWLNILAFEMWRQFHPKHMLRRSAPRFRWKKLAIQSLYGWGMPIVLTAVYCLLRLLTDHQLFTYLGDCPTYFERNTAQVIFIAVVNEMAVLISMILFILIVINMRKIKASVEHANKNQQMFWTYVKLMTLASFSVIFYVLKDAIPPKGKGEVYWVPTDIFICLHGFLLFLMDCCTSNTRKRLKKGIESFSSSLRSKTTSSSCK